MLDCTHRGRVQSLVCFAIFIAHRPSWKQQMFCRMRNLVVALIFWRNHFRNWIDAGLYQVKTCCIKRYTMMSSQTTSANRPWSICEWIFMCHQRIFGIMTKVQLSQLWSPESGTVCLRPLSRTQVIQWQSARRRAAVDLMETASGKHASNLPRNGCQKHYTIISIWYYYPSRMLALISPSHGG